MTVALPEQAEGAAGTLPSHCSEAMQNQYNGKNASIGKADGFLKKCSRNRTTSYAFVFLLSS